MKVYRTIGPLVLKKGSELDKVRIDFRSELTKVQTKARSKFTQVRIELRSELTKMLKDIFYSFEQLSSYLYHNYL